MKFKNFLNPFTVLLAISVFFTCCKKGDTGPAGATGPAGPAGAAGAAGTPGAKGDPGTANVIYSAWLDVGYGMDTIQNGAIIDTIYIGTIAATKLTSAILNTGEIKVYLNLGNATDQHVVSLPHTDLVLSGVRKTATITPHFFLSEIDLLSNVNAGTLTDGTLKYRQYRYVLIPGGVTARMTQKVDFDNYQQVKDYYKIPD